MSVPVAAALVLLPVALAACSAEQLADVTAPSRDTLAPMTTVVEVPTTSATVAATVASTTTATPTTSASTTTTIAPTTTAGVTATTSVEDELRLAYQRAYDGYWACLRAPLNCDTSWLVEGGPSAVAMQGTMQALADRARFVGPDDVGYFVIEHIAVDPSGERAEVTACWWSTAVLYGAPADPTRPAGPDNPPTIVNNTHSSGRQLDVFTEGAGAWQQREGELLDDGWEYDTCAG
jgi:hypothetical protein